MLMAQSVTNPRQRIIDHGEVFTPPPREDGRSLSQQSVVWTISVRSHRRNTLKESWHLWQLGAPRQSTMRRRRQ